jgi:Butirosin biosynthesis protein H, N-terminal
MAVIKDYTQFGGSHYETGTVHNLLAYAGAKAPHTGQPYSEAMLLGISGGIAFGYFVFDYKGYAPLLSLIPRNTFDPLETLLSRLNVPREVYQSTRADKAEAKLVELLEAGQPVMVTADQFSLPYNRAPQDPGAWAMLPLVVYGYDDTHVMIADRSHMPLTVDTPTFRAARARIRKDRFRMRTLRAPDGLGLADAIRAGIQQCAALYTEKPPKGAVKNFGFAAMRHWAEPIFSTKLRVCLIGPGCGWPHRFFGKAPQPGTSWWQSRCRMTSRPVLRHAR